MARFPFGHDVANVLHANPGLVPESGSGQALEPDLYRRIRANCTAPDVTMTVMVRHRSEDEMFRRVNVETTPFPRLGEVSDIASTITFLCSPGAGFINGQTIVVDGGWTTTKYMPDRALRTKSIEPDV